MIHKERKKVNSLCQIKRELAIDNWWLAVVNSRTVKKVSDSKLMDVQ